MKHLLGILLITFIGLGCKSKKAILVIQNTSDKASLRVHVLLNKKEIFDNYVTKAIASTAAVKSVFESSEGSNNVEVMIPEIGLHESSHMKSGDIRYLIVTIRSLPTSAIPLKEGDLTTVPKKEIVTIAFKTASSNTQEKAP